MVLKTTELSSPEMTLKELIKKPIVLCIDANNYVQSENKESCSIGMLQVYELLKITAKICSKKQANQDKWQK